MRTPLLQLRLRSIFTTFVFMNAATDKPNVFVRVWNFYAEGFRSMTIGKYLWAIIIIKLVILFLVFRLFLFPDILARDYDNDEDRAQAVRTNLIHNR